VLGTGCPIGAVHHSVHNARAFKDETSLSARRLVWIRR
jgi:hypothetical protein